MTDTLLRATLQQIADGDRTAADTDTLTELIHRNYVIATITQWVGGQAGTPHAHITDDGRRFLETAS